jgi:hypothetical protein
MAAGTARPSQCKSTFPSPPAIGRAGRRVRSILYGFQPLWVCPTALLPSWRIQLNEFKLESSRLLPKTLKWCAGDVVFALHTLLYVLCTVHFCTVKKVSDFSVPSWDVPNQTRDRVCWPLLCLCGPFCIFERCLYSNP